MKKLCKTHQGKMCELHKADKVNEPVFSNTKGKDMRSGLPGIKAGAGTSYMGAHVRNSKAMVPSGKKEHSVKRAKEIAGQNLKRLQDAPKPNLGKTEHTCKLHKHEEGYHDSAEAEEGKLPANPDNEDNRTDDCAYCQDLDAEENADGTAGMHDCDACKEYDAS